MTDRAVPNLPSRDLSATSAFYGGFGFVELHRDDGWLIVRRGELQLEFFLEADLDPRKNAFGACLRVADLNALHEAVRAAGVPKKRHGFPSMRPIARQPWGQLMSTVLDPDGNLLRLIADDDSRWNDSSRRGEVS